MKRHTRILLFEFLLVLILLTAFPVISNAASKVPRNKLVTEQGTSYYYNHKGKIVRDRMITWKKNTYYFDKNGQMYRNRTFSYQGHVYHARNSGALARNTWIDGYYYNSYGQRTGKPFNSSSSGTASSVLNKKPQKKIISMKNIRQNPQLPTGCESVALTIVLKHMGFPLSKTTIASRYLSRSSSNFVTKFWGNPFSGSGGGIYAPGLTITANKYLKAKKSAKRAYDLTGIRFSDLYTYLDNNIPVIVWNSMYMRNPVAVHSYRYAGKTWHFYRSEHCVVLCGYDKKNKKVLINDPLSGLVWRKASSFERIYNKLGKMAGVIQ